MVAESARRGLIVSKAWIQASALVILFGFSVMSWLAYGANVDARPVADQLVDPTGAVQFTGADVITGQEVFLRNGLMEYGSTFGHGAYLGPDYTADALRRAALDVQDQYGGPASDSGRARTLADFQTNRYDATTRTLTLTAAQAHAFQTLRAYYQRFFSTPTTENGLRPGAIVEPEQTRQLTAFFTWSAWASAARRPGQSYSYTNNWPPEPRVGNTPTADNLVWSVLSLVALLGGIGLLFAAFGRWNVVGWHGRERRTLTFLLPGEVALTPAQRTTGAFFLVMAGLFLAQTLLGGASQHYRADLSGFFGIDLARWFPYNLTRTWHVQLSILWVATSFLAAGIFLAPMIGGRKPARQHWLAYIFGGTPSCPSCSC